MQELPGLTTAKRIVARLMSDTPVHAVLFYGSEGAGKSLLADLLAKAWLCRAPTPEGACGECQACLSFERERSADYQKITPQPPSYLIRLGTVVERQEEGCVPVQVFFRTPPLAATAKVVVIEDADRMNPDAANALLKTLEEPPPYARLILTTRSPGEVLPTVLSRCLAVACELPRPDQLGTDPYLPQVLAQGALRHAAIYREKPEPYQRLFEIAQRVVEAPPPQALRLAEDFRDAADKLSGDDGARASNAEALKLLALFLSRLDPQRPERVQAVLEAHRRIVGNAQAGLVLDSLFAGLTL